ncbi:PREDICTED: histone deacetylase 6-like [Amphimedon queenslandica]|uniref:Protein deacetylase HDAC6 n=1 Tax=Amphimedon queenslandica TaxID=400682 RepID=A0A1X7VVD8_AMPQE|nr:PREDICTED: histone deacetylase 6-like [Amphimedon queenslandica]|eukprot:XP_003382755.1 PREDICTED: histone deacetylase 6-like [Amphimedon queenslandica]
MEREKIVTREPSDLFDWNLASRKKDVRRKSSFTSQCVMTGIVYDERMKNHRNDNNPNHPECPERISSIWEQLVDDGVVECCRRIDARSATEQEILYVHSKTHYDEMVATENMSLEKLFQRALRLNSIYINPSSMQCALLAAGSVCEVTKLVIDETVDNGVAIVRPPGHHAESYTSMGFCFFNNVAIAAKMAIEEYGVKRILIIDWDVHHGNATQHMFYDDNRVLYVSLHRHDNGGFYPGGDEGDYDKVGKGKGSGYNVNIPWNLARMGDAEYMSAFYQIIMPIAFEYQPELVIVSSGFDSGEGDPIGGYRVTPNGYAHMTHQLKSLADGKIVVALEGGYNLTTISHSMSAVVQVLLGDTPRSLESCVPNDSALASIGNAAKCLSKYWKSLRHWQDQPVKGTVEEFAPLTSSSVVDPAPLTDDSMSNSQADEMRGDDSIIIENGETPKSKPMPDESLKRSDEEILSEPPPPGTIPISSDSIPLDVAQKALIQQLEDEGNACMFAVNPLSWCPHLESIVPIEGSLDTSALCETCSTPRENWVCLTCQHVHCGRYINKHMLEHSEASGHNIVLSYADLSVWCFTCDSYVYNPVLFPFIKLASDDKFK